jgi:putative PIN family toxin of toxin-antitoxin system
VIRAVVDTNVVVSGILNRAGVPAVVLRGAGLRYELVWTPAIAVESRRILDLPRILKRLKGREVQARQVLARLATLATMVPAELLGEVRVVKEDPDDDVLFATALAGGARTIVSGDAAVLAVGSFAGVLVVSASELLATLGEA